MLNHIWAAMMFAGFVYGTLKGKLQVIGNSMLDAAGQAVSLSITLLGVVAFWCGIMEIAQEIGLTERLGKKMWPLIHFLFPAVPKEHKALNEISLNFIANILGLGWAATPAGLRAMEALEELEEERRAGQTPAAAKGTASNEMCTFLIINISSLQLIPVNIIAYRSQYGSANPTAIVGPAIVATAVSTLIAILFCRIMNQGKNSKNSSQRLKFF
ncbi:MAG: nucleoside recognition protein [Lachnospiraceae bacterium]|nr:nucleoside recognition protein [Lachnospiraceae bacterium]